MIVRQVSDGVWDAKHTFEELPKRPSAREMASADVAAFRTTLTEEERGVFERVRDDQSTENFPRLLTM